MYEIDGTTYTGADGLTALAALSAGAPTAAFGTYSTADHTFTASRVNAGSSVQSTQFDAAQGTVIARAGDQLTLRGVTLDRSSGSWLFERGDVTLTVGAGTTVTKAGELGNNFGADSLSVGQRVHAFGTVSQDSSGNVTLDATSGRVRMEVTHAAGFVKSAITGTLTLDVQSIDRRRISDFDFSGTGASPAQDADPANYEVATGSLTLAGLDPGAPAEVLGFVTPFGMAPPDFTGTTVADFRAARAELEIGWGSGGTAAPFTSVGAGGIVIDATNTAIGEAHFIRIGPTFTDIVSLSTPATIVTDTSKPGVFAIREAHSVQLYSDFSSFTDALATKLSGGEKLVELSATGSFDAATGDFTSQRVLARFKSAD
jgi:hypothetical protein